MISEVLGWEGVATIPENSVQSQISTHGALTGRKQIKVAKLPGQLSNVINLIIFLKKCNKINAINVAL